MANLTRVDQSLMTDFVTYSTIIAANNYLFGGSVNCIISQASSSVAANGPAKAFQLNALTGVTSVACYIQGSNDNVNWLNIGLISLSAPGTDGFSTSTASYRWTRANITTLIGGNCSVLVAS